MRNIALSSASMPWLELTFNYRTELVYLIQLYSYTVPYKKPNRMDMRQVHLGKEEEGRQKLEE